MVSVTLTVMLKHVTCMYNLSSVSEKTNKQILEA